MLSPRARARLSGLFQALEGLPAVFGQTIVLGMLVVTSLLLWMLIVGVSNERWREQELATKSTAMAA